MVKKTIAVRIDEELKKALAKYARTQRRTLSNLIEIMIIDYCERNEIELPEEEIK